MAEYNKIALDPSFVGTNENVYIEPPSHHDIAMAENNTKYRVPFLYPDGSNNEIADDVVLDAGGNEVSIYQSTGWSDLDESGLMDMFAELNTFKDGTDRVAWDKVDYEIYGEDWYREKYPSFPG